ncbi:MAG TPA: hypothetical protein VKY26_01900 [Actinomycetota bacterium]|nr:hypothetical protein [Actinomycetota bacterium]
MRTMLTVVIDTPAGNAAVKDGAIGKYLDELAQQLKPEAMYFFATKGKRTALAVFDMTDSSQIPAICEPIFQGLNAEVELQPVMNAEDLQKGLAGLG